MANRIDRKNKLLLLAVLGPVLSLLVSWAAYLWIGVPALLVPPVLIGVFLALCYVDLRQYQLKLFERGIEEQRSTFTQVEAIIGLNALLKPSKAFPATRGWAASPDLLLEMVNHVFAARVELAVEASSGVSTLMLAYAMERQGSGRVIAFEHDAAYAARTRAILEFHGVSHRATVVHAPLVDHRMAEESFKWYDLASVTIDTPIGLLVVDGPPEGTGPMARYPAVPLLCHNFAPGARVLLDDGERAAERLMAERWTKRFGATACELLAFDKPVWSLHF